MATSIIEKLHRTHLKNWLEKYDLTSKQEGWYITNDSAGFHRIAKIDDPQAWINDDWPLPSPDPVFESDDEAILFVLRKSEEGSEIHQQALQLHISNIPITKQN